ncbi:class I SAM-dependent methyltransferase [Desulfovibrio inopinatus]|uniref:class I SAM-dependent methyltransferase n=1 Tax=Desulfovibrio inopinatus TaxID=102109 RepID=UPI00041673EA|nr:class I SAM-dependent methyltransferase [Desulfovibrio inopinatus]
MNTAPPILKDLHVPQVVSYLEGLQNGFRAYKVMEAALDLELFELLDAEPGLDRETIAKRLGINGMFIRSFLLSLVGVGLLNEEDEKYFNSDAVQAFLVRKSPLYQGEWMSKDTGKTSSWSDLVTQLRKTEPAQYAFDQAPKTDFIRALGQRSLRGELQAVMKAVASWGGFDDARLLLDLGGGHGLYAIGLCQLNPELRGVILDKPHVVTETNRIVNDYAMAHRLHVAGVDLDTDDFGEGFDIILISHLLYKFRTDLRGFLTRVRRSLKRGGLLVSNHWFCAPGCIPTNGLMEMEKAFMSFGHPLCHIETFQTLLAECGFELQCQKDIASTFGTSNLHVAVATEDIPVEGCCGHARSCCSC